MEFILGDFGTNYIDRGAFVDIREELQRVLIRGWG